MKNYFEIETGEQLRAISDPLRRRLLEIFGDEALTTKQAAIVMNEKPTKLYHHVDLLERTGLIELVKTRQNRGTMEKYYRTVARKLSISRELIEVSAGKVENSIAQMLAGAFEDSLEKIRIGLDNDHLKAPGAQNAVALLSSEVYLDEKQVNELVDLVQKWLLKKDVSKKKGRQLHQLTMAVFPVAKKAEDGQRSQNRER